MLKIQKLVKKKMQKNTITLIAVIGIIAGLAGGWAIGAFVTPMGGAGGSQTFNIVITGSTTVEGICNTAADDFMDLYPTVSVSVVASGSGAGITDTENGLNDIGMSSRDLEPDELYLEDYHIAKDGLTAIADAGSPNADLTLTMDELFLIYNGTYTFWDDGTLGGTHTAINVYTRPDGSGTRSAFEDLVYYNATGTPELLGDNSGYQTHVSSYQIVTSNSVMVTQVSGDDQGIGYCGLGYVTAGVDQIAIDGVLASVATVLDGTYPISRSLHLVTNGPPTGYVRAFIDFIFGPLGQAIVAAEGFIPLY
jgi:phosphate transport system substrate-binding protein